MDQTKLVEAGAFLLKRKFAILAITVVIALLMVICNCFLNSSLEETYTLKVTADMKLDSFVSTEAIGSSAFLSNDSNYPFDDAVTRYIEEVKLSKKGNGRLNPYSAQKRLTVENIQPCLLDKGFSEFLTEKGFKGSVTVRSNPTNVVVTVSYGNKSDATGSASNLVAYVEEYMAMVMKDYVKEVRDTHATLVESDAKEIEGLLAEYTKAVAQTKQDVLSNEKCRSILSSYAQVAYNQDVSKAAVMISDQLLEVNIGHDVELVGLETSQNNSTKSIAVFGVFGVIVGLIFACFIVYVANFIKRISTCAKEQSQQQNNE